MIKPLYNERDDRLGEVVDKLNELIEAHNALESQYERHFHTTISRSGGFSSGQPEVWG